MPSKEYVCCSSCGREMARQKKYPLDSQFCAFCWKEGWSKQTETKDRSDLKDILDELPGFEFEADLLLEEEDDDDPD